MTPNLKGSLFMVAAMCAFAAEDALLKSAFEAIPRGLAFTVFGILAATLCATLSLIAGERVFPREFLSRGLLIRSGIELVGRLFFTLSLALVSLSLTSVILQATPLVVTLGAAVLFGEKVGPRRWTAMLVGFLGVILILRPTPGHFDPLVILPVLGMLGFAGRDLATRAAPPHVSGRQLGTLGFIVVTLAGLVIWAFDPRPPTGTAIGWAAVAGAGLVGTFAYNALTTAMRTGEVSVVAPFRYSRLLVALVVAYLAFGERVDALTFAGAALIVGSGLYTLIRSGRAAAPRPLSPRKEEGA
ncbi:DMT family transporter [Maritimibacter sp. DP1N21-5]|uniref:DMT family transporter n=1 Tax=Maritimibacter sp. DP1N21-5 TaxID=2836867 RepID=UPI001C444855|nr:DMT family transporter [Maritimibacter sp. DP1N21-5]MBV7408446.1 DMT family transporter [Maritimibacter sp. DP1N21-5]